MFPALYTRNFFLREIADSDAEGIFALRSDPEINKYLDRPPAQTINDAVEFISRIRKKEENKSLYWVIQRAGESGLSGTICIWDIPDDKKDGQLGFEVLRTEQGKGIIKEVLPAVLDYGFRQLNLECIYGLVETGNLPSVKIMERFNFKRSEFEPGLLRFELWKDEWEEKSE